jgi:hypothetical protein
MTPGSPRGSVARAQHVSARAQRGTQAVSHQSTTATDARSSQPQSATPPPPRQPLEAVPAPESGPSTSTELNTSLWQALTEQVRGLSSCITGRSRRCCSCVSLGSTSARGAAHRHNRHTRLLTCKTCALQFRRESLPWIEDLVAPLLAGPPQPLTGPQRSASSQQAPRRPTPTTHPPAVSVSAC